MVGGKGRDKRPRAEYEPPVGKVARGGRAADNLPALPFKWATNRVDWDGPFSWKGVSAEVLLGEIIPKLKDFEGMTWSQVEGPTGSHFVNVTDLVKPARKRLKEIGMDDTDQLFSLRISGKQRVWGVRDAAVFQMIWWDPEHEICPSQKKGT